MDYDDYIRRMKWYVNERKRYDRVDNIRLVLLIIFLTLLVLLSWYHFDEVAGDNREYLQGIAIGLDLEYKNISERWEGWHNAWKGYLVVRTKNGFEVLSELAVVETCFHEVGHHIYDFLLSDDEKKFFCDDYKDVPIGGYDNISWCSEHFARQYAKKQIVLWGGYNQ